MITNEPGVAQRGSLEVSPGGSLGRNKETVRRDIYNSLISWKRIKRFSVNAYCNRYESASGRWLINGAHQFFYALITTGLPAYLRLICMDLFDKLFPKEMLASRAWSSRGVLIAGAASSIGGLYIARKNCRQVMAISAALLTIAAAFAVIETHHEDAEEIWANATSSLVMIQLSQLLSDLLNMVCIIEDNNNKAATWQALLVPFGLGMVTKTTALVASNSLDFVKFDITDMVHDFEYALVSVAHSALTEFSYRNMQRVMENRGEQGYGAKGLRIKPAKRSFAHAKAVGGTMLATQGFAAGTMGMLTALSVYTRSFTNKWTTAAINSLVINIMSIFLFMFYFVGKDEEDSMPFKVDPKPVSTIKLNSIITHM